MKVVGMMLWRTDTDQFLEQRSKGPWRDLTARCINPFVIKVLKYLQRLCSRTLASCEVNLQLSGLANSARMHISIKEERGILPLEKQ